MSDQDELFPGGHVVSIDEGGVVASLSAWAREFGVHYETVRRGLMERGAKPVGKHRGHDQYLCRDVVAALSGSAEPVDPEKLSPFNRRAWYQGELDRQRLQQQRGELIPQLELEQEMAAVVKILIEASEGLPDLLERDCGLPGPVLARVEQTIDKVREEMHKRLLERAGAAEEGAQPLQAEPGSRAPRPKAEASAAPSTLDAAGALLKQLLEPGPRLATELIAEASARGISESSVRRAKAKLGIAARRSGKSWVWQLPEDVQGSQAG